MDKLTPLTNEIISEKLNNQEVYKYRRSFGGGEFICHVCEKIIYSEQELKYHNERREHKQRKLDEIEMLNLDASSFDPEDCKYKISLFGKIKKLQFYFR